jgi:hypothetical protein
MASNGSGKNGTISARNIEAHIPRHTSISGLKSSGSL